MPSPTAVRRLSSALAVTLSAATIGLTAPAAVAATTYSAPLQTAVRQLPVSAERNAGYDRERYFGDWVDADGDCLSTQDEVLAAESQVPPTPTRSGCSVVAGRWTSPYDGRTVTSAAELEVDHLVPVSEAWGSGAKGWTQAQRLAFYNDLGQPDALNAVPRALNQAKGALGPEQWLPPAGVCRYIAAWTAVKVRWSLSVDPAERAALISRADACPDSLLTVETVDVPAPPVAPPVHDQPPQITVTARTIDHGRTTGLVVVGTAGAIVDLYAGSRRSAPRVIRTATLAAGTVSWTLQPGETTSFFAQVRGGARSATVTVDVRRTVTIGIRQAAGVYTFTGVVDRPVPGLQITLARLLTSGRVVGVASTRTNAVGAWTIRSRLAPGLSGYYALTAPTPDLQAGRSRLYGLVVPAPRAAAPRPAPVVRPPAAPTQPARPADVDCPDFRTRAAAQAFFDRYFPVYGDLARLDADNDRLACESLP